MKKLILLVVASFGLISISTVAQKAEAKGDPLVRGEDFLRICVRNNYGQKQSEAEDEHAKEVACDMYVLGIVSGINNYSLISSKDIVAAEKRGEASQFEYGNLESTRKKVDSFNLICVPDDVTVGQLRHVVSAYILKHLERSIWSTSTLTYHALTEAYPCAAKAPQPQH